MIWFCSGFLMVCNLGPFLVRSGNRLEIGIIWGLLVGFRLLKKGVLAASMLHELVLHA